VNFTANKKINWWPGPVGPCPAGLFWSIKCDATNGPSKFNQSVKY